MHLDIDIQLAKEIFNYDSETGVITYKKARGNRAAGSEAGVLNKEGYRRVTINKRQYLAHRIAWAIHHGEDPGELEIDHINKDRTDNRISNLRKCTRTVNAQNTAGKGACFTRNGWQCDVTHNGKHHYIGRFKTEAEATAAYRSKKQELINSETYNI